METSSKILAEIFRLSDYEARLYLAAIGGQEASLSNLAKRANIPRTAAYPPVQSLMKRGLFSAIQIKKRILYRALEPSQLMYAFDKNRALLSELIIGLTKSISDSGNKLSVQYFSGSEGLLMSGQIFLTESKGKVWRTFENPKLIAEHTGTSRIDDYVARRVARGIHGKAIIPADSMSPWLKARMAMDKEELRHTVVVAPSLYPIDASIAISDNMVQIIATNQEVFSVIIRNKTIALTLASIHDMAWDRYSAA